MKANCIFCKLDKTVVKNDLAYVRYDKYPVTKGHSLILPVRHVSNFFELTDEERISIFHLLDELKVLLDKEFNPDGYNIGINIGESAGQTVWHAHMHLIPRYEGDIDNPQGGVRGVIPGKQKY